MIDKKEIAARYWGVIVVVVFWALIFLANAFIPSHTPRRLRYAPADFAQYYMGGAAIRYGIPGDLYPETAGKSLFLSGVVKPSLAEKLKSKGRERSSVYIYPPPLALFFFPFTFLSYRTAALCFTALNCTAVLLSLLFLQSECNRFSIGRGLTNVFVVLAGCSLPMTYGILVANTTPMIMLSVAGILAGIRKKWMHTTAMAFIFAGLTKGFSAPWSILLVLMRQWRIIASGAFFTILLLIASSFVFSIETYVDFFRRIIPESRCLYWVGDGNLGLPSLAGFLLEDNNPVLALQFISLAQYAAFLGVYYLVWKNHTRSLTTWYLAMFLCTLTMQLFSPLCWPHYILLLLPFFPFGWARSSKTGKIIYASGWILAWFPLGNILKYVFKIEVLGYGRTLGYIILGLWGFYELTTQSMRNEAVDEHN